MATQEYMSKDWQIVYAAVTVAMIIETLLFGCLYFTNPFRPVQGVLRARAGRRFFDVRYEPVLYCCLLLICLCVCVTGVEEDVADDGPQDDADFLLHFHPHGAQLPGVRQKVMNLLVSSSFLR
jgi:hypothetical protein